MAEEVESGASVHLSHDPLGAGVDAFGAAVVVGQGEAGVHGGPVDFEAVGQAAQVGQADGADGCDPLGEFRVVVLGRFEQGGKATDEVGEGGQLRAGRGDLLQQGRFLRGQVLGVGEQEAAGVARVVTGRSPSAQPWLR